MKNHFKIYYFLYKLGVKFDENLELLKDDRRNDVNFIKFIYFDKVIEKENEAVAGAFVEFLTILLIDMGLL